MTTRFESLAGEFDRILKYDARSEETHWKILGEFRDIATSAGRLLVEDIKQGRIDPPDPLPVWLALGIGDESCSGLDYEQIATPDGILVSRSGQRELEYRARPLSKLPTFFCPHHYRCDENRGVGGYGRDPDCYALRHAFIEAVMTWLADRHPELVKIELPKWTVTMESGDIHQFVSDWLVEDVPSRSFQMIDSLIRACRDACQLLGAGAKKSGEIAADATRKGSRFGGEPEDAGPTRETPSEFRDGTKLIGWADILEAIKVPNTNANQKRVRRYNENHKGPIGRIGRRPAVEKGSLLTWWGQLDRQAQMNAQRGADRQATSDLSEQKRLGMHETKRPNAGGGERPSS